MKNSETYHVYTGMMSQYVANMRKFVTENSKRALNKKELEAIYPYLQRDEVRYMPAPKYWILSLFIMTFEDFCWMRFMCLSEMDMILFGSLNTIMQVYSTLEKRKQIYRPTIESRPETRSQDIGAMTGLIEARECKSVPMMPLYDKVRERVRDYGVLSASAIEVGDRRQAVGEGHDIGKEHRLYNELKC